MQDYLIYSKERIRNNEIKSSSLNVNLREIESFLDFYDVRMPEKDGCETLKEIEVFDRNANIVLLTAFSADKYIMDLKKTQQVRLVEKPFEMTEIVKILKTL